ncbi:hypothetical protein F5Y02DRAFT_76864 [Annulohypoxylon stygium]|nr:hypothetical protein F5Y02DRAFT_76864 [Annulohypoxylon stygium]
MYEPKKVGLPGTIIETSRPVTFDCSMYTLRYNSARLVTNYGILGPRHGLPPSYLSYIFSTQLKYYGNQYLQLHFRDNDYTFFCLESSLVGHCVLRFESWEAKLVGPELYLSATYRWMQPDADNQALQDYLACKYLKVCKHATVSSASLSSVNLPPIARKSPDEADYHCTGSCKFCLTDWDASIEWISPTHGWMVTVTTYHDFGNCRSLSHWKWQAMTTELQDTKNRDKPSGAVKSRWLEG